MPKLNNIEGNILLEINLLNNDFLDVDEERQDSENWIPFEFVLNVPREKICLYAWYGATFSVYEIKSLIEKFEQIAENKLSKKKLWEIWISSSESYFDIIVDDPLEDGEIYMEIWLNIGTITDGELSGYDKGFRFVVKLDHIYRFTKWIKKAI